MSNWLAAVGYGTALFCVLASMALGAVSIVAVWVIRHFKRKWLLTQRAVHMRADAPDTDAQKDGVRQILEDTGYAYDWEQDIFYSVANPWQRKMGYCSLYDEWATPLGMVFDCEPVHFEYNGKQWLIEFWKGQYGITTGGEIGIYHTADPGGTPPIVFQGTFYQSASDEEALNVAFALFKKGNPLFTRADKHWWLTGFVLGEYSEPSSLTMKASVAFLDPGMRDAFLAAFRQLGYGAEDFTLSENTFSFLFAKPRTKQPLARRSPVKFLAMLRLKAFVDEYRKQTNGLTNMYDILTKLKIESPLLYQFVINIGRQRESYRNNDAIIRRLG